MRNRPLTWLIALFVVSALPAVARPALAGVAATSPLPIAKSRVRGPASSPSCGNGSNSAAERD